MWKYHLCYGYMINRAFHNKKLLKWNGLVFHWCLHNKQNITWPLGDTKFLFSCWKNISLVRSTHLWNIFQHLKRNFVPLHGHVICSIIHHNIKLRHKRSRQHNNIDSRINITTFFNLPDMFRRYIRHRQCYIFWNRRWIWTL